MRDEKEQVPDETQIKPSYGKYFRETDTNLKDKFNEIMLAYGTKDPNAAEMLSKLESERGNIYSIGIGILKSSENSGIIMSVQLIAQAMLMLAFQLKWHDMINKMITDLYDRVKGYPISFTIAFTTAINKGYQTQIIEVIKKKFEDERNDETCALLVGIDNKKLFVLFKNDLIGIANDGEGIGRMNALSALAELVFDDAEVKDTFMDLLDDWDDDARYFCAGVFAKAKNDEVAFRALELLPDEQDAGIRMRLAVILENNKDTLILNLLGKLAKAKTKYDIEEIVELLLKVEKKKKLKELIGKITHFNDELKKEIEKLLE